MDSTEGNRVRCTAWGERAAGQTAQCSTVMNWSSVLAEELLETNVIADRNMAVLKELSIPGACVDPALMSDLRHDREIRSFMCSDRGRPRNSEIMMEAKRILKKEEKAKKIANMQNKIVDDEVGRFQNHITSLRKMNQRLERIAFPIVKKRLSKSNHGHYTSYYCSNIDGLDSIEDSHMIPVEQDKLRKKSLIKNRNTLHKTDTPEDSECSRRKSTLAVSGSRMDEHEILQHRPIPISQTSSDCQNTVFERIHQRYIESEKERVLKEGTALIRHTSPITDCVATGSSPNTTSLLKDDIKIHLGEWIEENSDQCESSSQIKNAEVCIDEWSPLPLSMPNIETAKRKSESGRASSPSTTLPPAVPPKKGDHNKLECLSKMYAKWMTKVCVSPNPKLDDLVPSKNKFEKKKEGSAFKQSNHSSVSREEKIMQVLQALQKHKESKPSVQDVGHAGNSRFSKSVNDVREERPEHEGCKYRRAISGSYEHRLKAHKELISHQKNKLEEQKKEIEDLRLSQLRMESEKSQMLTRKALNEVLETCSENVKAQAKALKSSMSLVDLSPGNDFVLRMEQRAIEQKQKKMLAQERRKQSEEERKKKMKEQEEKKRMEEEELLRKKHEETQILRRKEREMREEARREREKAIALERKADQFNQKRRLRNGLHAFKKLIALRRRQEESAMEFYEKCLLQNALKMWKREVGVIMKAKMDCAEHFYSSTLLHCCFNALKLEVQERTRRMQVAMDMHDLHLQERYFRMWLKFSSEQQEIESEKIAKAELHFSKTLLRKYLFLWQKYPKVAQLEREKERRKMVWRNKVQQLLPDFRPVLSSE